MTTTTTITMIITTTMTSKGAIRDCLRSPHSNTYANGQGAVVCKSPETHWAHITCHMPYDKWHETTFS